MRRASLKQRVWAKVRIPSALTGGRDPWDECWTWRGAHSRKRDGERRPHVKVDGRMMSVARLVCEWKHGPAPSAEHHAGHTCPAGENASCVNPRHLEWQTPCQNLDRCRANKQRKLTVGTSNASPVDASRPHPGDRALRGRLTGLREPSRHPSSASFDAPDNA